MSRSRDDFTISELERVTGVSRTSFDKMVKKFRKWGISREVGRRGDMMVYTLNEDSPIVKAVHALKSLQWVPNLFRPPVSFHGP